MVQNVASLGLVGLTATRVRKMNRGAAWMRKILVTCVMTLGE